MKASDLAQHQILYRAPIVHDRGWKTGNEDGVWTVGGADVLDLNHSGAAETRTEYKDFFVNIEMYQEPVLTGGLQQLQTLAAQTGTEIVTAHEHPFATIHDGGMVIGHTLFQSDKPVARNQRPIQSLVAQAFPQEPSAQWAIDPAHGEFIIFK